MKVWCKEAGGFGKGERKQFSTCFCFLCDELRAMTGREGWRFEKREGRQQSFDKVDRKLNREF